MTTAREWNIRKTLAALLLVLAPTLSSAADLIFETSYSDDLVNELVRDGVFADGALARSWNGKTLPFMDKKVRMKAKSTGKDTVEMTIAQNLDLRVEKKSAGNFFFGGTGTVTLDRLDFRLGFARKHLQTDLVMDQKTPTLRIRLVNPSFRVSQQGKVKIEKKVIGIGVGGSTQQFRGVFGKLEWEGLFELRSAKDKKTNKTVLKLLRKRSTARFGHQGFAGNGVPRDQFLRQYGKELAKQIEDLLGDAFSDGTTMDAGEGTSRIDLAIVTKKLTGLKVAGVSAKDVNHLGFAHRVDLTTDTAEHVCASELVAPPSALKTASNALLFKHRPKGPSLNTVLSVSYFEQALFLSARAGSFCAEVSDGVGGRITFFPTGKIDASTKGAKVLIRFDIKYRHENPAFPSGAVTGQLQVERQAVLEREGSEVLLVGTKDSVSPTADGAATALATILASSPFEVSVPKAPAIPGYKTEPTGTAFDGEHFVVFHVLKTR